jgi:hypothetical protein
LLLIAATRYGSGQVVLTSYFFGVYVGQPGKSFVLALKNSVGMAKWTLYFYAMIILHAVQKLLKTSRLKPALYLSAPTEGQQLHSWYVKLASAGFPGKLLTMYVHEPSLLTVLTKGRSIKTTLPQFYERLPQLLQRHGFRQDFIGHEMQLVTEGYVVSKTNSKSMLGFMNE